VRAPGIAAGRWSSRVGSEASLAGLAAATGILLGGMALAATLSPSRLTLLALIAVMAPFVAMAVGDLRRALLVAIVFDIPLQWDVSLNDYRLDAAAMGSLGGLSLSVTTIALAGLYALWAVDRSRALSDMPPARLGPAGPLLAYLGANAASLLVARDAELSVYELLLLAQTLLLFIYVVSTVRTRSEVLFIAIALVASLLFESLVMLVLGATGWRFSFLGLKSYGFDADPADPALHISGRLGGTLGSPNNAGSFLATLLPLVATLPAASVPSWVRRMCLVALPIGFLALILTGSRGGWLSIAVSTVIVCVVAARRGLMVRRTAVVGVLLAVVAVIPFAGDIAERVAGDDSGAARSRVTTAKLASAVIIDRPLLGVGVNNLAVALPDYAGPEFGRTWIYAVHTHYLLVWSEAGIGALLAFVWFLAATIRRGVRGIQSGDPLIAPIALGLTAGVAGHIAHMFVDLFNRRSNPQLLWLAAAVLAAMASLVSRSSAHRSDAA
jgi:O-antigen ligase